jgi:hygromycin-B 7''-O-kinase
MIYPRALVEQIGRRHGLAGEPELLRGGLVNEAWRIGDAVIRIVHKEGCDGEAAVEARVVPLATAAGIRTPALIAADLSGALAPRPYTIYRRIDGVVLGYLPPDPARYQAAFHELGVQAAALHQIEVPPADRDALRGRAIPDPRRALAQARDAGAVAAATVAAIADWLDHVEPALGAPPRPCLVHNDLHPWNLVVDPDTAALVGILDWGDARLGDPAMELTAMPLFALPAMLAGYRAGGGVIDDGFVARALWSGTALALWEVRALDPNEFDRGWWRMPPGGWPAMRAICAKLEAFEPWQA